ncbi:MAG: MerR family transcriptional regulator [Myxococcota bacterium]
MQPPHDEDTATLSIGAVSKATGIPVETLRTWERRYGFPKPERAQSGHRKYRSSTIAHLKLISEALERGHRPVHVMDKSVDALKVLLDLADSASVNDEERGSARARTPSAQASASADTAPVHLARPTTGQQIMPQTMHAIVEGWVQAMMRLDHETLQQSFESVWYRVGPMSFLSQLVSPFLEQVGQAWFEGRIAVLHEQFASNQLRKFLSSQWRPLSQRASGPRVVCTTLPGEYHAIGLHMVSVVMSLAGCQVLFLGIDTPTLTITQSVTQAQAEVVLVSVSSAANAERVTAQLSELCEQLPRGTTLLIGGRGAPEIHGAHRFTDLYALFDWAQRECLATSA